MAGVTIIVPTTLAPMLVTVMMAMSSTQKTAPVTNIYQRARLVPDMVTSIDLNIPVSVSKAIYELNLVARKSSWFQTE